jgi:hypothetical protein
MRFETPKADGKGLGNAAVGQDESAFAEDAALLAPPEQEDAVVLVDDWLPGAIIA